MSSCKLPILATSVFVAIWDNTHMKNNLRALRKKFKLSQEALARKMGTTRNQYVKLENGSRRLSDIWIDRAAKAMDIPPEFIISDSPPILRPDHDIPGKPETKSIELSEIAEINVRARAAGDFSAFSEDPARYVHDGETVKEIWGIPGAFLRENLQSTRDAIQILEILGNSMAPALRAGDRVFVDLRHRLPSPPGIYALWEDRLGIVVKRVERIPGSNPEQLKLISDNPSHGDYTALATDTKIIGRVCARLNVM